MARIDPQHQSQLNEITSSYAGYFCAALGGILAIYTTFNALGFTNDSQTNVLIHDGTISAFSFIAALFIFNNKISQRFIHGLLSIIMLSLASSILHSMYLDPRPIFTIHFLIFFLAVGTFFLSLRWGLITIFISAMGWFTIGAIQIPKAEFADYALTMIAVILTSVLLMNNRINRNLKLIVLRHKDRDARKKLAESIEETKKEIIERQKAESEQNRLESQLRQAQRLEAVGRLAGGVAHDINNMLAAISGTTEAMLKEVQKKPACSGDATEDLNNILEACKRGKMLTSNLLGFAQKGKYRREQINVNRLISNVKTFMERTIPEHIWFETILSKDLPHIEGDPGQINQVLVNLINNAVDAMDADGHLIITTEAVDDIERQGVTGLENTTGKFIKIIVSDTGRGMKEGTMERAFEPFFSTKKMGEGTGLGLSMVYGTITNHGGAVLIRSAIDQGTSVTIYLPEYTRSTLRISSGDTAVPVPIHQHGTVLLVDDEPLVRRSGKRILSQMGFSVVEASSGEDALQKYTQASPPVDVVLLDLIMPGLEGDEVYQRLREKDPDVKVIFVSAYSKDTVRVDNLLADGAIDFIQKPFSIDQINLAVTSAMAIPKSSDTPWIKS
ncbi:MAG: response regulator [Deltaproteobacteria bacterium]|nr:response regulator [Deltaproteobacteria bacterium]